MVVLLYPLLNEVNKKDVFTLMTATTKELFIHASMRDSRFYLTSKGLMDGGLKSERNFNLGEVPKLEQDSGDSSFLNKQIL